MTTTTKPTIHMNGTSRRALYVGYFVAYQKIADAIAALSETAPNGRDYYPQGDAAIIAAGKEHRERMTALRSVLVDLEELAAHTTTEN